MKRILILSANPKNTNSLRLDEEIRAIDEGLKRSRDRDQFELIAKGALRIQDLYRHLLEFQPEIIHFSGHGTGEQGLALEDESGQTQLLSTEQLAVTFKLFAAKGLICVVLNACYSEVQAIAINQFIPYAIGINQAIGDRAAIQFAVAFYDTLCAGESIDFAFELAKSQLIGLQEDLKPVLLKNPEAIATFDKTLRHKIPNQGIPNQQEPPTSHGKKVETLSMEAGDGAKQIGYIEHIENMTF